MTASPQSWRRPGPALPGAPLPPRVSSGQSSYQPLGMNSDPSSGRTEGASPAPEAQPGPGYSPPAPSQAPPPEHRAPHPGYPAPGYQGGQPAYRSGPPGHQGPPPGYQGPPPGYQAPPAGYYQHQQPPPGYPPGPSGWQGAQGGAPGPAQRTDIAEWWQRLVARIIDGVGFMIVQWILSALFFALLMPTFLFDGGSYLWVIPAVLTGVITGLLYAGYDVVMHSRYGATAGKMVFKLKLARADGQPLTQAPIIRRAAAYPGVFVLVGLVAGLGLFAFSMGTWLLAAVTLLDGIFLLVDQVNRQSLHDRFAGTVVLKTAGSPTFG